MSSWSIRLIGAFHSATPSTTMQTFSFTAILLCVIGAAIATEAQVQDSTAVEDGNSKLLCETSMGGGVCTRLLTGCYCVIPQQLTWHAAFQYCQARGASLVSVSDPAKQIDLQANLPRLIAPGSIATQVGLWTSGTYFPTLGIYIWAANLQPFLLTQHWQYGQPSNPGPNSCVRMIPTDNYSWDDLDCYQYLPFVCESFML